MNTVLTFLISVSPIFVSVISLVVHFFVFHRLKCTKDLAECMREHFPDVVKDSLENRVLKLENVLSQLLEALQNGDNR